MRRQKIVFLFFIPFILVLPLYAEAQLPPPSEIPRVIPEDEVLQFMDKYTARFMEMDLDAYIGDLFYPNLNGKCLRQWRI